MTTFTKIKRTIQALRYAYGEVTRETVLKCLDDEQFQAIYVIY